MALQEEDDYEVALAVDDEEETGWSLGGLEGPNQNRQAVFVLKEDTGAAEGMNFTFTLGHRLGGYTTLGRFRLSATTAIRPLLQNLVPLDIEGVLSVRPEDRSPEQTRALLDYYIGQQPRMREWQATLEGHHKAKPKEPDTQAPTIAQNPEPPETHVHTRGDFFRKGEQVMPGTPSVLPPLRARRDRPDRLSTWPAGSRILPIPSLCASRSIASGKGSSVEDWSLAATTLGPAGKHLRIPSCWIGSPGNS